MGQLLDAALDRAELAEPLVGRLDLVGEPHDALLRSARRRPDRCGDRSRRWLSLSVSDLTSDSMLFGSGPICSTRVSSAWVSSLTRCASESRPLAPVIAREVIDARAERLHVAGDRRDAFGRCDAGRELAQFVDRGLEIAQRLRIGRSCRAKLSILCESSATRASKPGEALGRRHLVERAVHLRRGGARCRAAPTGRRRRHSPARSASASACTSACRRFERAARQRIVDGARDVGEVGAQRRDRILDAARPAQRLDLLGDVDQLPFEAREIRAGRALAAAARQARRGCVGASSSARWRAAISAIT